MDAKYERMQQWKAGFLAMILLLAMCLIIPAAGGFADWYNELNSDQTSATSIYEALPTHDATSGFDADGTTALRFSGSSSVMAPKSYFYYYNTSTTFEPLNKCNVTALTAGVPTVTATSTVGNTMTGNDTCQTNGWPYFVLVFDYRAWDAYYDDVCRMKLNISGLKSGTCSATLGDWEQTVTLYWGDTNHIVDEWTVGQADTTLSEYILFDTNDLRTAIVDFGTAGGYLTLKITRTDSSISISESDLYVYSATNLVPRDDALGVGVMAMGVLGFVGALVVQPSISLNSLFSRGKKGKGRGL